MNDNYDPNDPHALEYDADEHTDPLFAIEPPDWVWDISAKWELCERTDCPQNMVMVLLQDAADLLGEAAEQILHDRALSSETKRRVAKVNAMIADANKLYPFCATQPELGIVTESEDGTLRRSPIPDPPIPFPDPK